MGVPHSIRFHGHDFFVMARSIGDCTDSVPLKLDNPPRRDTAMLPASGYLVMTYAMSHWYVFLFICNQIAVLTSTQAGTYARDLRCSSWSSMTRLQG
ncbi:hypothetical protein IG631_18655 [Alternaria alternata]|nr:hypothetical protein IG631_18655 [Alternaria alternata]